MSVTKSRPRASGYGALRRCGRIGSQERDRLAAPARRMLAGELRTRRFLDAMFRPSRQFRIPADDATLVCRCEEVSAGRVRESIALGCSGLTVSEMIADSRGVPVAEVGALRMRPPVKPLLLGELAALTLDAPAMREND